MYRRLGAEGLLKLMVAEKTCNERSARSRTKSRAALPPHRHPPP